MTNHTNQGSLRRWLLLALLAAALGGCGLGGKHGSLAAAAKYEANGQYRAAYIESKKVLQQDNKNGMAWLLLGKASLMLGNPQDAINDLQNAKAHGVPESEWAIPMGRALLVTQQFDTLLKTLPATAVTSAADRARLSVLLGDAHLGLKQADQARQAYQSAMAIEPGNPRALLGMAKVAASENDLQGARKFVEQAMVSGPNDANVWIFKGNLAFGSQDFPAAETDYEKVLGMKNPDLLPQEQFFVMSRLADSEIQQNKVDSALGHIDALEKMAPSQPYPHYLHAVAYYKQGHFNDAVSQLQQVLKTLPNNEPAQLLMGAVNYAQGNYSQAEMYLSNVLGLDEKNAGARELLAMTLYREGQSHQALDVLRPAIPGHPSDAALLALIQKNTVEGIAAPGSASTTPGSAATPLDAQLHGAMQAMTAGNVEAAIRLLKALPAGNTPVASQRYTMLVMAYLKEKHPEEAVRVAAQYAHQEPQSGAAHLLYGTTLVAAGRHTEARAEYLHAHQLDPRNIATLMSMGSLDVLEGRPQDAINRYQMVLKIEPGNAFAMTALGRITAQTGDIAQAVGWFKRAIHAAPKEVTPYLDLIVLYSSNGQFADALSIARSLVENVPDNPAALNALGAVALKAGQYKEALNPLERAVKAAPQEALYRTNLARAQILNKESSAAEANLNQVHESAPDNTQATILLAFLKLQNDDMAGALALAHGMQAKQGTEADGWALEGDLYMAKKLYPEAVQAYQRGLKLNYTEPLVLKTFLALNNSGKADADRILLKWLEQHPDDDATRMVLGQYYLDHAEYALSGGQFERVLKDYPTNVTALNNLAWIYTQQGNSQALSLAERAYGLAPASSNIQDTYGWTLVVDGQAKKALPILQQAVKQAPAAPTIRYHLAVAQARTGNKSEAVANLRLLLKSATGFPEKADAEKLYRDLTGAAGKATRS